MPYNGSGTFTLVAGNPVVTGTTISSTVQNNTMTDISANGLTNCVTKDGQTTLTANIPMGNFKLTGLAAGTAAGNSIRYEQLFTSGLVTLLGTLKVPTTVGVGAATPAASGAGVSFPATQSASSDANTLDDYEEGTWTPTDTSGAALSITNNGSSYTKVGRLVHVQMDITYPATADGTAAAIGALPFTPVGVSSICVGYTNNGNALNITILNASTSVQFLTAVNGTPRTNANLTTNGIAGGGTYNS